MKISPISHINAAYSAFAGGRQPAGGQSPQAGSDSSSHPVDTVWLSSEAQAHLRDTADSDTDADSSRNG